MAKLGTAYVDVEGNFTPLQRGIDRATKDSNAKFKKLGRAASLGIASGIGGGIALVGVEAKRMVDAFTESEKIGKQTNAVLKSTGRVAGVSAKHVGDLATAISKKTGIDDEAIQSSENLLLTFTNVRNEVGKGNDIFDRATKTVQDMSVALGQDGKSSAIQLGKALNDPVKGITALQRVGVTFTKGQKDQIKTLTESGHRLDAQKIILRELNKEFGGSAQAQAQPLDKLKVAVGNLEESVGSGLKPVIDQAATALTNFATKAGPKVQRFSDKLAHLFNDKNLTFGDKLAVIGHELAKQLNLAAGKAAKAAPHVAAAFVRAWLHAGAWTQLLTAAFIAKRTGAFSAAGSAAGGLFVKSLKKGLAGPLASALRRSGETAAANAAEGLADHLPVSMNARQGRFNKASRLSGALSGRTFGIAFAAAAVLAITPQIESALQAFKKGLDNKKHGKPNKTKDLPIIKFLFPGLGRPRVIGRRAGGTVPGSGSGDIVPAMLEPGEFVMRKKVVNSLGPGFFHRLNGYKEGGEVAPARGLVAKVWERVSRLFPGGGGPMPHVSFSQHRDSGVISNSTNAIYLGREALSPDRGLLSKSPVGDYWRDTLVHEFAHSRQKAAVRLGPRWEVEGGAEAFMKRVSPGIYRSLGIDYHASPSTDAYADYVRKVQREHTPAWVTRGQFASGPGSNVAGRPRAGAGAADTSSPMVVSGARTVHHHYNITAPAGEIPDGVATGVLIARTVEARFGGDVRQEV